MAAEPRDLRLSGPIAFYIMFEDLKFQFSLGSDNHSGFHPRVLEALAAANRGSAHAYGMDEVSSLTAQEFKRVFGENAQAEYVFTGTAANILCMAPALRSFQSIICSEHSHLHLDECGAPEKFLGGKLWTLPSKDGKIYPKQTLEVLARGGDQHYSQPRIVSLTQPTELGVCYTMEELRAWRLFTRSKNLMLHLDGARLANAAAFLNVSLEQMTSDLEIDMVSFGGTKNGLMGAEACILISDEAKENFKFHRKQAMQLSSKTRFLAAQFYAYLKDDLWREIARHTTSSAQNLADQVQKEFPEIELAYPVQSNALFVRLPKAWINPLREKMFFYVWNNSTQLCRWMIGFDWNEARTQDVLQALREVKNVQR